MIYFEPNKKIEISWLVPEDEAIKRYDKKAREIVDRLNNKIDNCGLATVEYLYQILGCYNGKQEPINSGTYQLLIEYGWTSKIKSTISLNAVEHLLTLTLPPPSRLINTPKSVTYKTTEKLSSGEPSSRDMFYNSLLDTKKLEIPNYCCTNLYSSMREDKAKRSLSGSWPRLSQLFVPDSVHEFRVESEIERDDRIDSCVYAYRMLKDQAVVKPIDKEDNKMQPFTFLEGAKYFNPKVKDIQVYNNRVVKVIFTDGTFTKAVCDDETTFDYYTGVSICLFKRVLGKEGHKTYNNLMRFAFECKERADKKKEKEAEAKAKEKQKRKKAEEKRIMKKQKASEERIAEQEEAIIRATIAIDSLPNKGRSDEERI